VLIRRNTGGCGSADGHQTILVLSLRVSWRSENSAEGTVIAVHLTRALLSFFSDVRYYREGVVATPLVSQLVDEIESKFQRLRASFRGPKTQWK
jgi:hypothetical protein